ncbi:MAG: YicC family protein [Anaerolineae bacterium]|nr:YicC family protein [Gemmatimonadaceae bacterium]
MTGFGTATGKVGSATVTIDVRTVNHRFFNSSIKLPFALSQWEGEVRELLRRRIGRGHVTVSARVDLDSETVEINEVKFAGYVQQLRDLQRRFELAESLDVATLLRLPNVMATGNGDGIGGTAADCLVVLDGALDALMLMRDAEGARLAELLGQRLATVAMGAERIAGRAPSRLSEERERMRLRVTETLNGLEIDAGRLAQEIAILADRLDVSEEIDRFRAHVGAFGETLSRPVSEPVGKRLGFLLQEMLREANTAGSKAKDTVMLHEVVSIKEELERIAEQVENIE